MTNTLYALAFAFRKTSLWQQLNDRQLFAVRLPDGSIGYCCVRGQGHQRFALTVYLGQRGLESYQRLLSQPKHITAQELRSMARTQDALQCAYAYKHELSDGVFAQAMAHWQGPASALPVKYPYPFFTRYQPRHVPWLPDLENGETAPLIRALEAGLEVSRQLAKTKPQTLGFSKKGIDARRIPLLEKEGDGFLWGSIAVPPAPPVIFPTAGFSSDDILAIKRQIKRNSRVWACDVYLSPHALNADEDAPDTGDTLPERAVYPFMLMAADMDSGEPITINLGPLPDPDAYAAPFLNVLLHIMAQQGAPPFLVVENERTHVLLEPLGIPIVRRQEIPVISRIKDDMVRHMRSDMDPQTVDKIEATERMLRKRGFDKQLTSLQLADLAFALDGVPLYQDAERQLGQALRGMMIRPLDMI